MRLVKGAGKEGVGACWMSALHWYTRWDNSWSDHPKCVSPTIRTLCILLNDKLSDKDRAEIIGPHLFTPVGTYTTDKAIERKRLDICAKYAMQWAASAKKSANAAAYAANAAANAADNAANSAANAADNAAANAANAAAAANAANAAADAADAVAYAANAANAARLVIYKQILECILECCAVGEKQEACPVKTQEQVLAMLE